MSTSRGACHKPPLSHGSRHCRCSSSAAAAFSAFCLPATAVVQCVASVGATGASMAHDRTALDAYIYMPVAQAFHLDVPACMQLQKVRRSSAGGVTRVRHPVHDHLSTPTRLPSHSIHSTRSMEWEVSMQAGVRSTLSSRSAARASCPFCCCRRARRAHGCQSRLCRRWSYGTDVVTSAGANDVEVIEFPRWHPPGPFPPRGSCGATAYVDLVRSRRCDWAAIDA